MQFVHTGTVGCHVAAPGELLWINSPANFLIREVWNYLRPSLIDSGIFSENSLGKTSAPEMCCACVRSRVFAVVMERDDRVLE